MSPANGPLLDFGVAAGLSGEQMVLSVRGTVDSHTAPELGAFFDSAIASGHRTVILDMTDLGSIDAAGLAVIASAASRLIGVGGGLTVRSPWTTFARILDVTWLAGGLRLGLPRPGLEHLGPEQVTPRSTVSARLRPAGLVHGLRRVGAVPADNDVVDGALRLVVALARVTVGGADGVSVSLRRHGQLSTVAASDRIISEMDADQYATGEGPCVDASVEGRWFHAESLDKEDRWPAFTPRARRLGINAILSSPLLAQLQPVGALNIYSRTTSAFAAKDQELAAVFAEEASAILTDAGVGVSDDQLAARLQHSLLARETIAVAQGVVMEREGVDQHGAYTILRKASQASDQPLLERAEDVVASTRHPAPRLPPAA